MDHTDRLIILSDILHFSNYLCFCLAANKMFIIVDLYLCDPAK